MKKTVALASAIFVLTALLWLGIEPAATEVFAIGRRAEAQNMARKYPRETEPFAGRISSATLTNAEFAQLEDAVKPVKGREAKAELERSYQESPLLWWFLEHGGFYLPISIVVGGWSIYGIIQLLRAQSVDRCSHDDKTT